MGCERNFGTQSCPIELEAEEKEGQKTWHHNKGMDGLKPSLPDSTVKIGFLSTNLELVPYKTSSPSDHDAPPRSQESENPEPMSPSIQDMGPLRNAESGNESPGFAEGSLSLDAPPRASPSPGATRSFKRLTKAHKAEHSDAVSSQKTELEQEMELFEVAEGEEEAHLLTSFQNNESNVCSTSPTSPNSVESIQIDWKRGPRGTFGQQPRPKRGQKPGINHQALVKEEDVCFSCFDGGELILCDKRACPKAYHMECTGRKSDFFLRKGLWYCGWHVCANCSRSANVHCYMCPHAFCSGCTVEAEFLHIRKGRGLCELCYSIVYMIEHNLSINSEGVEVDFDDEETYECLFRHYWKDLKQKTSLTWSEIDKAYKAKDEQLGKGGEDIKAPDEKDRASTEFDSRPVAQKSHGFKRKRGTRKSAAEDASCSEYEDEDEDEEEEEAEEEEEEEVEEEESFSKPRRGRPKGRSFTGWASKELVDFLHSIKEDTKKPLTLILVNKLVLQYVEANKLNCGYHGQITCDERLRRLFGKKIVGKFQMMKLLTKHIASKWTASFNLSNGGENLEVSKGNEKGQNQHKSRRKQDEVKQVQLDASSYASIDMKNMSLIYLKRSLLEDLRRDPDFERKVTGAFVRIRVPSMVNKNDTCYRLVQIVGIKQVPTPQNNGKPAGVTLEILNLSKREEITVDLVSSQDFTEEECQRLRQIIKLGVLKAITVGEFQEKARVLREVKIKDWFDMELLRLSHLRDRASEKGHRKELRECVERLQLLSSPSERERQLRAPVQVTSDPRMDPDYKSDNDGHSMHETQGTDNGSGRRRSENNSLPVKLHKQVDNGGWPKFVSNSGAHAQGNEKGFEKDHGGHVSEKPGVGWGPIPCDDKSGAFKAGRKDGAGKDVLCLNSNCEDGGLGGKLLDKEMDTGRAGSADAKTSDGWVVEAGSKQNDGWEANAGGNRNSGKCPDTDMVVEEWGKPESFGKGIVCGQETWKQKTVNREKAGRAKKDSGWGGVKEKIKCEDGWEVKPVDNRINAGWGSSNNNNDGWESMEGGWGGNAGGNIKEDGWGGNVVGNSKEDGWGGNTGGNSKHGGWEGKVGGSGKDHGWEGNAGAYGKDGDAKGNTGAYRRDGGWGGKMRFHSQNDDWGGNPSACKRDGGWKGNTRSPSKYGWGGKGVTHKKDDDGWEGGGRAQRDDGWGDDAGIECRNGGWGHCAGSSEKDPERGFGSERGTGFGWGKVGGSRRDHDWGDNAKSSRGNRSDGTEGFTRLSHRDNEAFEITSGQASFLPPQGRGTVHDASTRPGVDGAGANRNFEKEKIWYYQDPSKAVQGPFSMEQLRKWERTKLFPLDLKVWRATEGQDASVLLADALLGRCSNDIPPGFGHHVQNSQGLRCGVPEERKCVPVTSTRLVQDSGPRPKWDTGNGNVAKECHHGITEGARPWRSLGTEILFSRDSNRDCSRGHRDRGADNRDYSEHHYPHRPGNDNRFSTQKKNFPCKYFARGGCKKGDECDFMH